MEKDTPEKNPFKFSTEQRTMPESPAEIRDLWFDSIIGSQAEGMENGVRPQQLFNLPVRYQRLWQTMVWLPYLRSQDSENRRAINANSLVGTGSFAQTRKGRRSTRPKF